MKVANVCLLTARYSASSLLAACTGYTISVAAYGEGGPHTRGYCVWGVKRGGAATTPRATKCARQDAAAQATPTSATSSSGGLKESPPEVGRPVVSPLAPQKMSLVSNALSWYEYQTDHPRVPLLAISTPIDARHLLQPQHD